MMRNWRPAAGLCALALGVIGVTPLLMGGCGGGGGFSDLYGPPFYGGGGTVRPPGNTGTGSGGGTQTGNNRTWVDPCTEPEASKYLRISMRNIAPEDYIHYFLIMVAYVYDATEAAGYADGAVCAADINLYRANGYTIEVPAGQERIIGNYCIRGRALVYFHENGRFRKTGAAGATLASAIAPAQGTLPTYDPFFTSAGARVPVPNVILFHNPGTGEGAALKIAPTSRNPCDATQTTGVNNCVQDAFYYVDEFDLPNGTPSLGVGSNRRVPNEIQGTQCQVGLADASQRLAPTGVSATNALDYEFLRGGRIDYVFLRVDEDPPFPQLVWRVLDSRGALVHDFDPRARLP